jgi:hypothetical protein
MRGALLIDGVGLAVPESNPTGQWMMNYSAG